MSPCYKRMCLSIDIDLSKNWDDAQFMMGEIEKKLEPYNAIPHWGKNFAMSPKVLKSKYPRIEDFRKLMKKFDPNGKFRNEFLDTYVY